MLKKCNRCSEKKDITLFSSSPTCKDGFRNYCKACQKIKKDEWRFRNKEHHNQKCRDWILKNPEKRREISLAWSRTHKEYQQVYSSTWRKENKVKVNFSTSQRRKRIKLATPKWSDKNIMKDFYLEAISFGLEMDHIIPLQNPLVCGLHVPDNIQLLTKSENSSKGNYYAP